MPMPRKSNDWRITWRVAADLEPVVRRYEAMTGSISGAIEMIARRYARVVYDANRRLEDIFTSDEMDWLMRTLAPPSEDLDTSYISAQVAEAVRLGRTDGVDGEEVITKLVRLSDAEMFALDERRRGERST